MKKVVGIYKIENKINGKLYIGQSVDFNRRKDHHLRSLRKDIHRNRFLQRAWNKYGEGNFVIKLILLCEKNELTRYEQELVNRLSPEYNLYKICVNSPAGTKLSEETRRKISLAGIGRFVSEETRMKRSISASKLRHSEETKRKLSEINRGKKLSEETKKKIGLAGKGNKHAKGFHHSEEFKKRISDLHKGVPKTEEHKKKDAEAIRKWWKIRKGDR